MGDKSTIEWTSATWNPIRGCSRVSEGCRHCYAERTAIRHVSMPTRPLGGVTKGQEPGAYHGLVTSTPQGPRWTGEVRFVEDALTLPLRWKAPRRIFVNSMSDLFHEKVSDEWIDRIFAVMALTQRHTYQILTKRHERMCAYLTDPKHQQRVVNWMDRTLGPADHIGENGTDADGVSTFPCPSIHLGVSVEDERTAQTRIAALIDTPAAVRWVSYEPALGPIDFRPYMPNALWHDLPSWKQPELDWIVVGGESGPGARPFDLAWARSTITQCRAAGVPVFVKQLGARPIIYLGDGHRNEVRVRPILLRDRKGGDWAEWPEDLRVREFPTASAA